ncbi:MAG: YceD family protein [Polyangiaceae bacterium]
MDPHEFSIPVHDLDAAGKSFHFPVRSAWVRGALEGTNVAAPDADGRLEIRLSRSGTDVVVRGRLQADVTAPCARCLEPARVPVDLELSVLVVPAASLREGPGGEQDGGPEQADVIPFDGETVVLDDLVRDELLLAIPMIPLCSEGCTGIRPELARELEQPEQGGVDPRLRPLLRFKKSITQ